ncbi:class I SAM-dependent methyltransferase [Streptomyces sp. NPDC001594]|uniref:class I SAM-dependent methyltransferase n=1 Tax=Streptomyces sp. NPDC001594 TaxID=3364590 RepID=UPI00368FC91E
MGIRSELQVVRHMLFPRARGTTPTERMESYYGPTVHAYDAFRAGDRLLHARGALYGRLPLRKGDHLVDFGAGTATGIERLGDERRRLCRRITLVDASESMLRVARDRAERRGWHNVTTVHADATRHPLSDGPADVVVFSYALTMIPDWFGAIDHALSLLRPGGVIGVCDFHVSAKHPPAGLVRHAAWQRLLWPVWFGHNNVFLSADHLPYLRHRFETVHLEQCLAPVPYVRARVPHYVFIGRKPAAASPHPAEEPCACS